MLLVQLHAALPAAVVPDSLANSDAQPLGPALSAAALKGIPAARCTRPADQEALRIQQLALSVQQYALLQADAGYETGLRASRRCRSTVAAR
jgi:hypothetical protein